MNRYSPQRELVLSIVSSQNIHWSAEDVFLQAVQSMPRISRATVYRNLETLEQMGLIQRMVAPNHVSYFEMAKGPHHHFVCRVCSSIQDYQAPSVGACFKCVADHNNFHIEQVVTTLHGLCQSCS